MPRLVIIDADEAERRRLAIALTSAGFEALEASASVEGLLRVLDSNPDLIILAEEMPPLRAADLLVILTRATNAPIIVIGRGGAPEETDALESGADAYLRRGFSFRLFSARVRALLRRHTGPDGGLASQILGNPVPLYLTATERRLLVCLSNHGGRPVPREEIRLQVWAAYVGADTVKHYLRRLRRKLQKEPCGLEVLCIRGVGYRLVPVAALGAMAAAASGVAGRPRRVEVA